MKSIRPLGVVRALALLFMFTSPSLVAHPQSGFPLMAGEIRLQGVLASTEDHPPKWLLHLEKPIEIDGKETNVIEVMVSPPGPAAPLTKGGRYEFTGRLDTQRNSASLRVTTIRRLDVPASPHKSSKGASAQP